METFSAGVLLVLFMVVFLNIRNGTIGDWLAAKFLNQAARKRTGRTSPGTPLPPGTVHV